MKKSWSTAEWTSTISEENYLDSPMSVCIITYPHQWLLWPEKQWAPWSKYKGVVVWKCEFLFYILFMELCCVNSCVNYTSGYQKHKTANPFRTSQRAVLTQKWDQNCWRVAQTCLEVAITISKPLDKSEMLDTYQSTYYLRTLWFV